LNLGKSIKVLSAHIKMPESPNIARRETVA